MIEIAIANRQDLLHIDHERLTAACRRVLVGCGHGAASLSLVFVDDEEMHALNREHLGHDYPTDVLSFPLSAGEEPLCGEVIVSATTAIANAAEFGADPLEEMLLYAIHGVLHLAGYGDKNSSEALEMRDAELRWLVVCGIPADRADKLVYPDRTSVEVGESSR